MVLNSALACGTKIPTRNTAAVKEISMEEKNMSFKDFRNFCRELEKEMKCHTGYLIRYIHFMLYDLSIGK